MPNTASAKKRLRQNEVLRLRNRSIKSTLRTNVKRVLSLVTSGEIAKAEEAYRTAAKQLDKASSSRVIHANAAARTKSRMQRAIKKAKQAGSEAGA